MLLAGLLLAGLLYGQTAAQSPAILRVKPDISLDGMAFLGIYSEQLSHEKARKLGFDNLYGSYVTRIVENSAAERAGVMPFDYIYGVDEYRTGKEQNLTHIIHKYEPGQKATLYFFRQSRKRTLQVTFGSRGESSSREKDKCNDPFFGITPSQKAKNEMEGVTVNIIGNSTAKAIGMENGDHIVSINDYRMLDWQDISTAINMMKVGERITVEFLRQGRQMKKSGPIKSYCETKPEEAVTMEIEPAPQPGDWFNRYFNKGEGQALIIGKGREVKADIRNLNPEESARLKREKNIEMSPLNNLAVEELSIQQEEDKFELEFTLPTTNETTIRIYNQAGRLIYLYDLGNFSGTFRDEVNLSQNGAGVFFLEIQQGNRSSAKKITLSDR